MKTSFSPRWFAVLALLSPPAGSQCPVPIDLTPGTGFSRPAFYEKAFGQELFFALNTATTGTELWKWSPATGVVLVADVKPGAGTSSPQEMVACCTAQGPRVLFSASATGANAELHMTTGTPGNSTLVREIRPGSSGSLIDNMTPVGQRVFFTANDGTNGIELWVTDGTTPGTYLVRDIRAGSNSNPTDMVALGDLLLFTADDGSGRDLWVSDGTAAGTININDQVAALGASPDGLTSNGAAVFFTTGDDLWMTDGTVAGTTMVEDLRASWGVTRVSELACSESRVFFTADVPSKGGVLFVSDGTSAGTFRVQNDLGEAVSSIRSLRASRGLVFFVGSHWASGQELWVSDGTDAGTALAVDVDPTGSSSPAQLTVVGGGVVFSGDDGINGREPWFSDGTPAGSFMLCDVHPTGSSAPEDFFMIQGQLWMEAYAPAVGDEPHVLATPGAHVEVLGLAGAPDHPTLATRNGASPVLGTRIEIVSGGPAGHVGLLFAGFPGLPAPSFAPLMQGGCDWVGLLAGTAIAVAGTPTADFSLPLRIADQPALEGVGLQLQMVWFDAAATPSIQLSNGLQLVLGEGAPH